MATITYERVTTRFTPETKALLDTALSLSGYASLNSFIANAAATEAKRLIEQQMRLQLCQEDALAFAQALDESKPPKINQRMLQAGRLHKELVNADPKAK